jgi:hypothetical protein
MKCFLSSFGFDNRNALYSVDDRGKFFEKIGRGGLSASPASPKMTPDFELPLKFLDQTSIWRHKGRLGPLCRRLRIAMVELKSVRENRIRRTGVP